MSLATLFGFGTNLGNPVPVRRPAPRALRALGALEQLRSTGLVVQDVGDHHLPAGDSLPPGGPLLAEVVAQARWQARTLCRKWRPGHLWLTLGGDHSTSLGTALGLIEAGEEFDIIWVDAHADFNTPATSPSGNPHGMVLAQLSGLTPDLLPAAVPAHRMHILGLRDVDPGEQKLLAAHGVHTYTVAETLAGPAAILERLGPRVFLSFDMDGLDPTVAPAVRTPVPGGFRLEDAVDLVRQIGQSRAVLAIDLVEYAADLDNPDQTTGRAALQVLVAAAATQAGRLESSAAAGR